MTSLISWLETVVGTIPLPLLEVWGRFSYIVGLVLAICAFGGFTFRVGERWGFGRERQTWDARAMRLSVALPIAETTTTTSLPCRFVIWTFSATARMRSGSATDVPPYFWTIRATGPRAYRWAPGSPLGHSQPLESRWPPLEQR